MSDGERYAAYTDAARTVLRVARDEARALQHNYVGTEHVLLGLVRSVETVASLVLGRLSVDLERTRHTIERIIGKGTVAITGEIAFSPRTLRLLQLAEQEARRLHAPLVGTEHLLLALVGEGEGIGVTVLANMGIHERQVREETYAVLGLPPITPETETLAATAQPKDAPKDAPAASGPVPHGSRFDKFTPHARRVMSLAQEEAQRLNQHYVGTEHLLLGLTQMRSGIALLVLRALGVAPEAVRAEVERLLGTTNGAEHGHVGLTPRAKLVIELAVDEARHLGHHHIGSEHLLLGMIREPRGIASRALAALGVALEPARAETLRITGAWSDPQSE